MNPRSAFFYFSQGLAVPSSMNLGQFNVVPQLPVNIGGGVAL